jgi:cell division transport system permease protein
VLQLWRIIEVGSRNLLRNAWLSTAATAVMTITLVIVVVSFVSNVALTSTIKGVTDKIDFSIFLKSDVTKDQVQSFENSLKTDPNVISVSFLTKEQAVAAFREEHKTDKQLLEGLDITGNTLPPSLQVKARDPKKLDPIIAIVAQPQNKVLLDPTAKPTYTGKKKSAIDNIVRISNFFKTFGLAASVIFVIISTLIIFNTIRMAVFTRRDEIEIMKLVGATKWFIRGPFIFEAALYGIIAAGITLVLSYTAILSGAPILSSYGVDVTSVINLFQHQAPLVILAVMLIGIAIGAFSSLLALSRYLKL